MLRAQAQLEASAAAADEPLDRDDMGGPPRGFTFFGTGSSLQCFKCKTVLRRPGTVERHRESKACVQPPLDVVPVQQAVVRQHWHQGETLAEHEHSASRGALAPERASPLAAVVALILRSVRRRMVSGGVQAQARRAHGSELSWRRTAPLGLRSRAAPGAHHVALVHPYILVVLEVGQATHRKVNAHAFSALLCDGVQLWASISQCAHSATQRRSSDRTARARTRLRLRRSWQRPRRSGSLWPTR